MKLKIGTRGSELALAQARQVRQSIIDTAPAGSIDPDAIEIVVISTKGDRVIDRPLSEIGGKGLFTEEIEQQLSDGSIDLAVHSSKDMPTVLPDGLELSCFLPREDPRDAFLGHSVNSFKELPEGAVVGTASLRRGAQALKLRPDLKIVNFRGNVQTRLKKLSEKQVDATLLAMAGIRRLGLESEIGSILPAEQFLPAPGQGAICIETRIGDDKTGVFLAPVNCKNTALALQCERAFLGELDGSCRTPIAGHAAIKSDSIDFIGQILTPDGKQSHETTLSGQLEEAGNIGKAAAGILKDKAGDGFFESW